MNYEIHKEWQFKGRFKWLSRSMWRFRKKYFIFLFSDISGTFVLFSLHQSGVLLQFYLNHLILQIKGTFLTWLFYITIHWCNLSGVLYLIIQWWNVLPHTKKQYRCVCVIISNGFQKLCSYTGKPRSNLQVTSTKCRLEILFKNHRLHK
jgi:hypothetical protein